MAPTAVAKTASKPKPPAGSSGGSVKPKVAKSVPAMDTTRSNAVAGPSRATVTMTNLEMMLHKAVLASPGKTMPSAAIRDIQGMPTDPAAILTVINGLLRKSLIRLSRNSKMETMLLANTATEARDLGAMDDTEKLVFDYISGSGNQGIWTRTLRIRSGVKQNEMNRVIKTLEQKKLIKLVKSIKNSTRKIYMLYDTVPSIDITGGPWYTNGELDTELIKMLHQAANKFIKERSFPQKGQLDMMWPLAHTPYLPTAQDILDFFYSAGILQGVDLNVEHVEALLDVLVFDRDIEKIWMKRFPEDGQAADNLDFAISPDGSVSLSTGRNGFAGDDGKRAKQGKEAKRKRGQAETPARQKKKKRIRSNSTDSEDIDNEPNGNGNVDDGASDSGADVKVEIYDEDEFLPPPPIADAFVDEEADLEGTERRKRPGPPGNDYYWVYRTCLASQPIAVIPQSDGTVVKKYAYLHEMGFLQTPCGICPVMEFCNNRGVPKTIPLPGEKDLSELTGPSDERKDAEFWHKAWIKDKDGKAIRGKVEVERAKRQELLKMKVPTGAGELEDADGTWQGGGKVGGKVIAPVNPATCVYYSQWLGQEFEW